MDEQVTRTSRRRSLLILGALIGFVVIATSACSPAPQSEAARTGVTGSGGDGSAPPTNVAVDEGTPTEGGSVVIGIAAETDGWNPAFAQWADAGNLVGSSVFEPLFVYDKDGNTVPWLAKSATPNADFTLWTITIRPGITFHDGTPVNADAFVNSISIGARDGLSSMVIKDLIGEIRATGDLTFTVTTSEPWPTFLNNLTTQIGLAAAPAMFKAENKMKDHPIGTGAYVFESWTPDKSFKAHRNDRYWGGPCAAQDPGEAVTRLCGQMGIPLGRRNGPYLDSIEFRPLPDEDLRVAALKSGDVDLVFTSTSRNVPTGGSDLTAITDNESEKTFLQLNTKAHPLDNAHARKALAYAAIPADVATLVSPNQPLHTDTSPFSEHSRWGLAAGETGYPPPDLDKAKAEVEAYKRETGEPTLSFTMKGLATGDDRATLQLLQQQFAAAGIDTEIETVEQVSLLTTLVGGKFQSILIRNYAYPDPDSQYFFFSENSAKGPLFINFAQYTSPEIETAVRAGRAATDVATRKAAYDKIARMRNDAVTEIWLYNTPYTIIASPAVHGLNPFRALKWGNFVPKPYVTGLWKTS